MSLPGADELFRPTKNLPDAVPPLEEQSPEPAPARSQRVGKPAATVAGDRTPPEPDQGKAPTGRVRHDEKITVYVSTDELLDLEDTRLALRREHGLAVDRGRLVREAIHLALEDAAVNGATSALVQRLNAS